MHGQIHAYTEKPTKNKWRVSSGQWVGKPAHNTYHKALWIELLMNGVRDYRPV